MTWHIQARKLIQQAGISQELLMPVFAVSSRGAVGHYLTGRRQPKPDQLKRLADFLGVKVDDFFADDQLDDSDSDTNQRQSSTNNLLNRLQLAGVEAADQPCGRRYDWSNPDAMSAEAFALKVLFAGRFEDLLRLAQGYGLEGLQQLVQEHAELKSNPWLQRKLDNIQLGLQQRKQAQNAA